jgi:outer membrane protein TolC
VQALDRWWDQFNDPQLTALVDAAMARSIDARAAAARLQEARAIRRGALRQFGLQGDLQAGAQAQGTEILTGGAGGITFPGGPGEPGEPGAPGGQNPFTQEGVTYSANLGFDVSWEADLFGRRAAARREAEATLAAERFAFEGARASLAGTVADTLFSLRGIALQLEDARETRRIQQQLRGVAQLRAQRGLGAGADVARIQADVAQAEADVTRLEAELQATRRALLVLTGDATLPTASLPLARCWWRCRRFPRCCPASFWSVAPTFVKRRRGLPPRPGDCASTSLPSFPASHSTRVSAFPPRPAGSSMRPRRSGRSLPE